jgi:hypothetical protein
MRSHTRRRLGPFWFMLVLTATTSLASRPACGGWSIFYVTNSSGTKVAEVAEQIFPTSLRGTLPASYGLDYEFRVLNISPTHAAIDAFQVFVGSQAGLNTQVNFVNYPHIPPPGYGAQFGALGNPFVPFLTAEGNTFSPVPWRFTEKDQRPGALTGYQITWTFTNGQPLPYNRWTEFDLFSPNGPVSGGGAVDPFAGPGGLGIDLAGSSSFDTIMFPSSVPISSSIDTSDPYSSSGGPLAPNGDYMSGGFSVPEPHSLVMLGTGTMLLALARWSRSRRLSRQRSPSTASAL